MPPTARIIVRWLTLLAFAAWQGGFFFYATFVVPIATRVLESARLQGAISQQVTVWLNALGAAALIVFAIDMGWTATRKSSRWWTWRFMVVMQIALVALHPLLDNNFKPDELDFTDRSQFKFHHGLYLWIHAAQWLAGLIWAWLTVKAWNDHAAH